MNRASQLSVLADRDPSNPILLCDLLDELLAAGLVDEALARLGIVPHGVRMLPGVRFREARCAMLRGDSVGVIDVLQPLLEEVPDAPVGIRHDLAYAQFALGMSEQALQTLSAAQGQGDDAVAIALLKARILYRQQQYQAAFDVLAPISSGLRLAEVQGVRALLLLDIGDTVRAAIEAEQALRLDPEQHEAGIVRGTVALWEQNVEASKVAFEQVLSEHPDSGRALLGLGQNLMLRSDIPAARALLERAAKEMPDHIGTWHALAWCQLLEGDLAGAKRSFDRAFAIDRTFGETHGGFALVHALRGERKEAEESIKRATRLDPNGRSARYAQSVLLLDEGRVDEARKVVDGILARSKGQPASVSADFIFKLRDIVRPRG